MGIVAAHGSFHGRTLGALAITGNAAKREPFLPLPGHVTFVDYGDVEQLKAAVDGTIGAVFLEPTLGEGGVVPPPAGYLAAARAICDAAGALLVIDEVQSGVGRTGHWLACEAEGIQPDILTLGKGLAGGLPLGACIAYGVAADLFAPGDHGSTFGGNPVSCAAALAVLDVIREENLLDAVKNIGEYLARGLESIESPLIKEVRGSGLWRGVALDGAHAAAVETAARAAGLLVNAVKPDVLRLAPALIVEDSEVDTAVELLSHSISSVSMSLTGGAQ
jgi:acetylornithine aminotransferase